MEKTTVEHGEQDLVVRFRVEYGTIVPEVVYAGAGWQEQYGNMMRSLGEASDSLESMLDEEES